MNYALIIPNQNLVRDRFSVGDLVTRDGTDVHRIIDIDEECHSMQVECIKEPETGWIKSGEKEFNLCRRYTFAGEVIEV